MTEETRQTLLKVLIPSMLVVLVYIFGAAKASTLELQKLSQRLAKAQKNRPSLSQIHKLSLQQASQNKALTKLKGELKRLEQELGELAGSQDDAVRQTQRLEALTLLLKQHRLALVRSECVDSELCENLHWLCQQQAGKKSGRKHKVWKFELIGRYKDVYKALSQLAGGAEAIYPVSLSLQNPNRDNPNNPLRSWTLVLWV